MATRFQKRIKVLPGVTVNIGKTGVSTSVGVKGAHVTVGNGKTRTTVGIPGTGLSHTTIQPSVSSQLPSDVRSATPDEKGGWRAMVPIVGKLLGAMAVVIAVGFGFLLALFMSSSGKKRGRRG